MGVNQEGTWGRVSPRICSGKMLMQILPDLQKNTAQNSPKHVISRQNFNFFMGRCLIPSYTFFGEPHSSSPTKPSSGSASVPALPREFQPNLRLRIRLENSVDYVITWCKIVTFSLMSIHYDRTQVRFCFSTVCDFSFFVCASNISGIAERICAKFTVKTCLVPRSNDF